MGVNKVFLGDEPIMDLSNDTVTSDTLLQGETAHDKSGNPIVGTLIPQSPLWVEGDLDVTTFNGITMPISNISHSLFEIINAINNGTIVKLKIRILGADEYFIVDLINYSDDRAWFSLTTLANLTGMYDLYWFLAMITSDDSQVVALRLNFNVDI